MRLVVGVGAALLSQTVQALDQFFVYGHNALLRSRLDPIVTPGKVSGHVHVFAGSNAITANMDYASATAGDCTTAPITADKSGYWAPQLHYKWKNGTYTAISGDGLITYWLYRGLDRTKGERPLSVPDDFRMVAGNLSRNYWDMKIPSHNAVSFQCFGPGYDYRLPYIPGDFECETIRPQIFFPNCWNGVDSYKPDQSHVSYPLNDYQNGPCPVGFKRIPSLFLETYIKPRQSLGPEYEWYPGCFVFANGDNMGLTFHADWLNGFPQGLLVDVYDQCLAMNGNALDCRLLAKYKNDNKDCQVKGQIVNEPIGLQTPLRALPGNNPEYNSSAAANNPKRPDPSYVETASLINSDTDQGGLCKGQRCTDYTGPTAGGSGVPGGAGGNTKSVDSPAATGGVTSTQTRSATTRSQTKTRSSTASQTTPTDLEDDEELVCMKRKKRRLVEQY